MSNEITWRLENENIGRLLVHYAIPAVIGTMVNALYNIVDRIFIGQGVGALAISGLTLTFPILLFMQAFGMLIGAGAATRVSIHLGRKANDLADNVLGNITMKQPNTNRNITNAPTYTGPAVHGCSPKYCRGNCE